MLNKASPITTQLSNKISPRQNYFSGPTVSPSTRGIEFKIFQGVIAQSNSAITPSWRPGFSGTFVPQTELGKKLWAIKERLIASGQTTNDWNQITAEINEARDLKK